MAQWIDAEDRLHPIALADPETYERYLRLLRIVADELASARTHEQLLDAYGLANEIAVRAIAREGFAADGLDLSLATTAAFGLRRREVIAEQRNDEILRRMRAARERGDHWVVVDETGTVELGGFVPYRRLEMHLPDGAGLYSFIEPSPEADAPVFGVQVVSLDLSTGRAAPDADPLPEPSTFTEREAWESAVADLRHQIGETAS